MVLTVVEKPSRNLEYGLTRSKSGDVQGSFDFGHGNVGGGFPPSSHPPSPEMDNLRAQGPKGPNEPLPSLG